MLSFLSLLMFCPLLLLRGQGVKREYKKEGREEKIRKQSTQTHIPTARNDTHPLTTTTTHNQIPARLSRLPRALALPLLSLCVPQSIYVTLSSLSLYLNLCVYFPLSYPPQASSFIFPAFPSLLLLTLQDHTTKCPIFFTTRLLLRLVNCWCCNCCFLLSFFLSPN